MDGKETKDGLEIWSVIFKPNINKERRTANTHTAFDVWSKVKAAGTRFPDVFRAKMKRIRN